MVISLFYCCFIPLSFRLSVISFQCYLNLWFQSLSPFNVPIFPFQVQRFKYLLQLQELSPMTPLLSPRRLTPWALASSKSFSVLSLVFAGWQIPWRSWFSVFCHQPCIVNGESVSTNKLFSPPLSSLEWCWVLHFGAKCLTNMEGKDFWISCYILWMHIQGVPSISTHFRFQFLTFF